MILYPFKFNLLFYSLYFSYNYALIPALLYAPALLGTYKLLESF